MCSALLWRVVASALVYVAWLELLFYAGGTIFVTAPLHGSCLRVSKEHRKALFAAQLAVSAFILQWEGAAQTADDGLGSKLS